MPDTPKGLATVAFLKTRLDEGHDHIGMFEPLVYHALHHLAAQDFVANDIQTQVSRGSSIRLPRAAISTLLRRLTKRGFLVRTGGRYFRTPKLLPSTDFDQVHQRISDSQQALGAALVEYANHNNFSFDSPASALEALANFVSDNKVHLVLDQRFRDSPLDRSVSRKLIRLLARFVTERCLQLSQNHSAFQTLIEGIILYDTVLLTELPRAAERFHDLTVVLDSPILFSAIGLYGTANGLAATEGITMLRESGARTVAFRPTVHEMRGILAVYEQRVATTEGRLRLRPGPLSHYVLTSRLSPADLRVISATLEGRVQDVGVKIRDVPPRQHRYTLGERELAAKLLDDDQDDTTQPRIRHDVDCIAGVLTLRAGRTSTSVERAGAIFCTSSGRVIRSVQEWFSAEGQEGIPPIIHQEALTSIAWLKAPAASRLKVHELAAVCAAAMRPTTQTWAKFVDTLRGLRSEGTITDDETVAIVVSELTEPLLARLDDDGDPDSDSIGEVVARVLDGYRSEASHAADTVRSLAQAEVAMARRAASEASAKATRLQDAIDANICRRSRALANVVLALSALIGIVNIPLALGAVDYSTATWAGRLILLLAVCAGVYSMTTGCSFIDLRNSCQDWVANKLRRRWLPPMAVSGKDYVLIPPGDDQLRPDHATESKTVHEPDA